MKHTHSVIAKRQNLKGNPTQQHRTSVQRATPANEHNGPYQLNKTEVPQHQPQGMKNRGQNNELQVSLPNN